MRQIWGCLRRSLYAAGLAATLLLPGPTAHAQGLSFPGPTVEAIKKRGMLVCGIDTGVPGFASQDNTGRWTGLDIAYCRAIAAALNTDPENYERLAPRLDALIAEFDLVCHIRRS